MMKQVLTYTWRDGIGEENIKFREEDLSDLAACGVNALSAAWAHIVCRKGLDLSHTNKNKKIEKLLN